MSFWKKVKYFFTKFFKSSTNVSRVGFSGASYANPTVSSESDITSSRLPEPEDELKVTVKTLRELTDGVKESLKKSKEAHNYSYFGFLVMVLVVLGLFFSYIEFIYSGTRNNDDYKYEIYKKTIEQETKLNFLKKCIEMSKWADPKCFTD